MRRVREHRALGHRTILITGALDFAVEGLRPLFDEIVAAEMTVRPDGTLSGEMLQVPPTGETRAQILHDYCAAEGLRIEEAVAYADSTSDLPLLEAVGFPVAVNPETRLAAIARKRGWLVEHWSKASGGPRPLLPIGPVMVERERRRRFGDAPIGGFHDRHARTHSDAQTLGWGRREGAAGRAVGAARAGPGASALAPAAAVRVGPLDFTEVDEPELPGPGWHRVHTRLAGICGSDLSMIEGHASHVLRRLGQLPVRARPRGRRPPRRRHAGSCSSRCSATPPAASTPPFDGAAPGDGDDYAHLATGHLEPGIQTGFCCSTGGGWAPWFCRPRDAAAPRRRRRARRAGRARSSRWPAASTPRSSPPPPRRCRTRRSRSSPCSAPARWASPRSPGSCATCRTCASSSAPATRTSSASPASSAPTTSWRPPSCPAPCAGSSAATSSATTSRRAPTPRSMRSATRRRSPPCLRITRPRGRVVLMGMPAEVTRRPHRAVAPRDRARRRLHVRHRDAADGRRVRTFDLAIETATAIEAERWLSATYRLADHVDAIAHAADRRPPGRDRRSPSTSRK